MTEEERLKHAKYVFDTCTNLLTIKGKSYGGLEDVLSNFKRNGERISLTKYQVWSVYFNKHIDSINNAIKYDPKNPIDTSEGLENRIFDSITYLVLLYCLLIED